MNDDTSEELDGATPVHQSIEGVASTASRPLSNVPATSRGPSLGRKIRVRLIFVGVSLTLGVALVEIIGRFLFQNVADDARYYQSLETLVVRSAPILEHTRMPGTFEIKFGYVLSPNVRHTQSRFGVEFTTITNSLGFRTREIEPRLPKEYRVMLIGDSFFYGDMIEQAETIGIQLERLAEADPDVKRPLRVYNFARSGYCTVQELIVANTYAPRVQPDAIILGFFAANDVIPNALTRIDDDGHFVPVADRLERFRNDLRAELGPLRHSLIFRMISLSHPFINRLVYRIGRQPWILQRNDEVLRAFQRFCQDHGYQFSVAFQHSTDSLSRGWRSVVYPADDVHRPLSAFCERSGIPFLDLRSDLLSGDDWDKLFRREDGHYNAPGAHRTAEAIYKHLVRPELVR
jgi:hypothetical protein